MRQATRGIQPPQDAPQPEQPTPRLIEEVRLYSTSETGVGFDILKMDPPQANPRPTPDALALVVGTNRQIGSEQPPPAPAVQEAPPARQEAPQAPAAPVQAVPPQQAKPAPPAPPRPRVGIARSAPVALPVAVASELAEFEGSYKANAQTRNDPKAFARLVDSLGFNLLPQWIEANPQLWKTGQIVGFVLEEEGGGE